NEGAKKPPEKAATENGAAKDKTPKKAGPKVDPHTLDLIRDLTVATIAYTRGSMADSSLPTQAALDEARAILSEAQKRLLKVGDNVKEQVADKELVQLTNVMYGRIPKKKPLRADASTWILSKDNILAWQNDLDAFESALYATDIEHDPEVDPFAGMDLTMEW